MATANDHTLYAHWTAKQVTVTFNDSSGSNSAKSQTFTYGVSSQSFNSGFTKTGYYGNGWATSSGSSTVTYSFTSGVSDAWIATSATSVNLYVVWKRNYSCGTEGTTNFSYAGRSDWIIAGNSGTTCTLIAPTVSSSYGTYSNSVTNLTNEYLKSGGSKATTELINEYNNGFITSISTDVGSDYANLTGLYWIGSQKVYSSKNRCYYPESPINLVDGAIVVTDGSLHGKTNGLFYNSQYTMPSCTTKMSSGVNNSVSNSLSSVNDYSIGTDSSWSTSAKYSTYQTVLDPTGASGTSKVVMSYTYYNSSGTATGESGTRSDNIHKIIACGGSNSNTEVYRFKYRNTTTFYYQNIAAGSSVVNRNFTDSYTYVLAAKPDMSNTTDDGNTNTRTWNFYSNSACQTFTKYTVKKSKFFSQ